MNTLFTSQFKLSFFLSLLLFSFTQAQNVDWLVQAQIIGQASALPIGNRVATDNSGNVFMSSYVSDEIQFGAFTTTGTEIVPGTYFNSAYITKLSATGEVLWIETFLGGGLVIINDIKADAQGNVYLLGQLDGEITFGTITASSSGANQNVLLIKLNGDGEVLWVDTGSNQAGYNTASGQTLEIDSNGNLIIHSMSGFDAQYIASYSPDGTLSWVRSYAGATEAQIALDAQNNIYWVGYRAGTTSMNFDITFDNFTFQADFGTVYLGKFNPEGSVIWFNHYDATDGYEGRDFTISKLAVDKNDNSIILGGIFTKNFALEGENLVTIGIGSQDFILAKYNSVGEIIWTKQNHGQSSVFAVSSLSTNNSGDIFITFRAGVNGGTGEIVLGEGINTQSFFTSALFNAFLAKYNSDGSLDWLKGTSSEEGGESDYDDVVASGDNSAIVTGDFNKDLILGSQTLFATPILANTNNFIFACDGDLSGIFSSNNSSPFLYTYPNPASQQVVVSTSVSEKVYSISLINSQGQLMYKKYEPQESEIIPLDGFVNGVYFVKVQNKNGVASKKLVKSY